MSIPSRRASPPPPPAAEGPDKGPREGGAGFGTFGGVFTPSILTILGVIMYLRFGWVVGNVGLIGALMIVTMCTAITFFTALSMAAIATDRRVRAGGAYYMISRSLGIETGGAVGIPLYFALALSVSLYTIGFAESVVRIFPDLDQTAIGIGTTIVVAVLAIVSSRLAIRTQYLVMAVIAVSLISFVLGGPVEQTELDLTGAPPRISEGFWVVFAVFFPAVTGIEAGVNMSGDLKNPQRSIPIGTLSALGTGYLVYMALPVFLSMRADPITLIEDPLIMRRMSLWGDAILLGVWGATLSSAMGSILGAPRVLQALARDGVLPKPLRFLGRGSGADDAPRIGTVATMGVALVAVSLGELNLIAPILSMFFLTSYMTVNLAAGIEGFLQSPSFRPAFRVHWAFSFVGAFGCLAVMFLINALATVVAAGVVLGIYLWLERRGLQTTWGDVRRGVWMTLVRMALFRLGREPDTKNWRPHLLVLSGAPTRRWHLIELANGLTHGRGMVTVATVLPETFGGAKRQGALAGTIREHMNKRGVEALVRVVTAPDPFSGAERLVDMYGLGPLVPNTIILGDSEQPSVREEYCRMVKTFHQNRRNVLIMRDDPERGFGRRQRIDVWWGGLQANGGLMMLLAYLLSRHIDWAKSEVHIKLVAPNADAAVSAQANLSSIIGGLRIGATPHVLVANGRQFPQILRESSADADLVLLGLAEPDENFVANYQRMHASVLGLPSTLFVLAGQELKFSDVLL